MAKKIAIKYIQELSEELDLSYWIEPEFGYIGYIESGGERYYFRNTTIDINSAGAAKVSNDKGYTSLLLSKFGYSVPEGGTFLSDDFAHLADIDKGILRGEEYAEKIGFPVFLKPNNLAQGVGVFRINNKDEYSEALKTVLLYTNRYRIEKYIPGRDYRVLVLDDKILAAYERRAFSLTGDGVSSIETLFEKKRDSLARSGRDIGISIDDPRIERMLKRSDKTITSIIDEEEILTLLDNANLSTGGDIEDITDTIHDDFSTIAISATKDLGLRLCGVDIIAPDITRSLLSNKNKYVILEMNASPGLSHYDTLSLEAEKRVRNIYKQILMNLTKQS